MRYNMTIDNEQQNTNTEMMYSVTNIMPSCAVILVLDTSHSMWGEGLRDMMNSLNIFYKTIHTEQVQNARVDIAAVSMGDNLRMLEEFVPFEQSVLPTMNIRPKGDTPIGQALELALDKLKGQEEEYRRSGQRSVASQLIILSDGKSTDSIDAASARIKEMTMSGRLICRAIATGEAPDLESLKSIAGENIVHPDHGEMHCAFEEIGRMVSQAYEDEAEEIVVELTEQGKRNAQGDSTFYLLDGSNIMHWDEARSGITLKYLLAITKHFEKNGIKYQVLFDASARHCFPQSEIGSYEKLLQVKPEQFLQVPARTQADDFLLVTADSNPACKILTNDLFRDHAADYPWVRVHSGSKRVIPGMVLNNLIFFPEIGLKITV